MSARCACLLLLAVFPGSGRICAAGFPARPSPTVVQPAPPPLPIEPDRWLPFRIFDWRDGLEPHVGGLAVDPRGYIWAGTPDGASFYNGHSWKRVALPTDPPDAPVNLFLAAGDGSFWVGTRGRGIFRRHHGVWRGIHLREAGLPHPAIQSFLETTHAGRRVIWVATSRGVARCEVDVAAEACRPVPPLWGLSVRALAPAQGQGGRPALWAATGKGLVRLEGIETSTPALAPILFDHRNALPDDSVRSLAESVSGDGQRSLWVGTDQGLARLRAGVWTRYDRAAGFPANSVAALLPGRWEGRPVVWAATFGAGLVRIEEKEGRWEVFGASSGLPSTYLYTLLATGSAAGEPTLWIATTGGLARLDHSRWHTLDSRSGLPSDTVIGAGEDRFPEGRTTYWMGSANGTVRLSDRGWELFVPWAGAPSPVVLDVAWTREARGPVFWMATAQGLLRHVEGAWAPVPEGGHPYFLAAVPGGDEIWAGGPLHLYRFAGGRWSAFRPGTDGLPGQEVEDLEWSPAGEPGGALWAGTDAGLARFAGERWHRVDVPCLPHPGILGIRPLTDARGNGWLWLGTRHGAARVRLAEGLAVPEDCQRLTRATHPQLPDPRISEILSDHAGRTYLFSDRGVVRLTAGASLQGAGFEVFDTEDGLPGSRFTRASFCDHRGRIWSGSASGVAVLDPAHELRRRALPAAAPLRIEQVLVNGRERPREPPFALPYRRARLEIEYALLSYRREHATRFRTQLVGLEEQPSEWTREVRAVYDRLPPGNYAFRVWGRDGDGVVSGPAGLSFRVLPPAWLTPWAFALYALALAGLIHGAVRLRVRTLAHRAAHLEALVAERTRDLAEANRQLELASFTDPLTGLNNRRFLTSTVRPDVVQAIRNAREPREPPGEPHHRDLVVYLLDLDQFKRLNDRSGHDAGDAVLVETAHRLRRVLRASDLVVRWGGEEILVVNRWTDREAGALLAERLLEAIGGEPFHTGVDRTSVVTCSIGWAPFPWSVEDPDAVLFEEVLSLADHALYLAKHKGRNQAVGVLPGATAAEEVAERILREDAPLHSLEGMQVELVRTPGPQVAADDRTGTIGGGAEGSRGSADPPLTTSGSDAMLRSPI